MGIPPLSSLLFMNLKYKWYIVDSLKKKKNLEKKKGDILESMKIMKEKINWNTLVETWQIYPHLLINRFCGVTFLVCQIVGFCSQKGNHLRTPLNLRLMMFNDTSLNIIFNTL